MRTRKILISSGIFLGGYVVGKTIGYLRMLKICSDIADDVMPGTKRRIGYGIVDKIFPNEESEESK